MGKVLMRRAYGGVYLQEESSFLFQMTGFQLHVEILIYLLNLKSYNKNVWLYRCHPGADVTFV